MRTVALVNPGKPSHTQAPPVGLGYLASALRQAGVMPTIADFSLGGDESRRFFDRCEAVPPLFVGITAMTESFPSACLLVRSIRSRPALDRVPIVLGGSHATALPRDALLESGADAVVLGEGEDLVVGLANALDGTRSIQDLAGTDGLAVRLGDDVHVTERSIFPTTYPAFHPAWDLHPPVRYAGSPWQVTSKGRTPGLVFASRGCPHRCLFCARPGQAEHGYRLRNPEDVLDEIQLLRSTYDVDEIQFGDDNLVFDREHMLEICKGIAGSGERIPWKTPNGIDARHLDPDLVEWMAKSGCYEVGLGIESGSDTIRRSIGKRLDDAGLKETISLFHKVGIKVWGQFILGLPGDTEETIAETIQLSLSLPLDFAHFSVCTPYPGSILFQRGDVDGQPFPRVWSEYRHYAPFRTCSLPTSELKRSLRLAYQSFYGRPSQVWEVLQVLLRRPKTVWSTVRRLV